LRTERTFFGWPFSVTVRTSTCSSSSVRPARNSSFVYMETGIETVRTLGEGGGFCACVSKENKNGTAARNSKAYDCENLLIAAFSSRVNAAIIVYTLRILKLVMPEN